MDNSIIEPIVKEILEKTKSGEYKWEPMGTNSFCLIAGDYSFSVRSRNLFDSNFGTPLFRFLYKENCIYEYVQGLTDIGTKFDELIRELSESVEKNYSEQIKSDMQKALDSLNAASIGVKK